MGGFILGHRIIELCKLKEMGLESSSYKNPLPCLGPKKKAFCLFSSQNILANNICKNETLSVIYGVSNDGTRMKLLVSEI